MVTNLPPQALAQYRRVVGSRTKDEKLQNLKIYLSMIPKHKGTAKLMVQVKHQISRLEMEIDEEHDQKRRRRSSLSTSIKIISKKSTIVILILSREKNDYLYFVKRIFGCIVNQIKREPFEITTTNTNGVNAILITSLLSSITEPELVDVVNKADIIVLITRDTIEAREDLNILTKLKTFNIYLINENSKVKLEELTKGINIIGNSKLLSESQIKEILTIKHNIKGARVIISNLSTEYSIEAAIARGANTKHILVTYSSPSNNIRSEEKIITDNIIPEVFKMDTINNGIKEKFIKTNLQCIGKIRVFTKHPMGDVEEESILMDEGSTVTDLATSIHKDIGRYLYYARIKRNKKDDWIKVGPSFKLEDRDIVELRMR